LGNPVDVDKPRSGDAGTRMPFEVGDECLDRTTMETRVCIENEHVLRRAGGDTFVCTGSVAHIGSGANETRVRMPSYGRFGRARVGRVVDDNDIAQNRRSQFGDRAKGIIDEIGRLIVDDDNVQTACG